MFIEMRNSLNIFESGGISVDGPMHMRAEWMDMLNHFSQKLVRKLFNTWWHIEKSTICSILNIMSDFGFHYQLFWMQNFHLKMMWWNICRFNSVTRPIMNERGIREMDQDHHHDESLHALLKKTG